MARVSKNQKLELVWAGKEGRANPEPRILLEDKTKSYSAKPAKKELFEGAMQPTYDNMLIHGDNLLALKSLEQEYAGQVKCIYIDPPYNTGSAFEQYDDGFEHSVWLSLMRDRLGLLNTLLSEEGIIAIQIDDNECHYLKILCDEIFGRENYINSIVVRMSTASGVKTSHRDKTILKEKEYILIYSKNITNVSINPQYIASANFSEEFQYILEKNSSDNPKDWNVLNLNTVLKDLDLKKDPSDKKFKKFIQENASKIWRRAFIRGKMKELSLENPKEIIVNKDSVGIEHYYYGGREMYFYQSQFHDCYTEEGVQSLPSHLLCDFWSDVNTGKLFNEGDIDFRNGKKPEFLVSRLFKMFSNPGDLVLDSFLGSGTTAAVAHKMGRRWIGIELGDHAYTHCLPRLQKVVDGSDQGGISKAVNWKGGGGFKFYELASSLIAKDSLGNDIISKEYNGDMLAEAMCKLMGYKYSPDKEIFWKQGKGTEKNYIFTTTIVMTEQYLEEIKDTLGKDTLLICCSAFIGNPKNHANITIKKIPQSVLDKCEWNKPGYPLPVKEDVAPADFEFDEEDSV